MLQIRHQVPGRVRFRIQSPPRQGAPTVGVPALAAADKAPVQAAWMQDIAATMARQPGVRAVRLNVRCASLVVCYDPARMTPERLSNPLVQQNLSGQTERQEERPSSRRMSAGSELWRGLTSRRAPQRRPRPRIDAAGTQRPPRGKRGARANRKAQTCPWCAMQRRLTVWLLRSTVRCWWHEWAPGVAPRRDAPTLDREPLLTRLRERFGGGLAGQALVPEAGT